MKASIRLTHLQALDRVMHASTVKDLNLAHDMAKMNGLVTQKLTYEIIRRRRQLENRSEAI